MFRRVVTSILALVVIVLVAMPASASITLSPSSPNPPLIFAGQDPSGGNFNTDDLVTVIGGGPYTEQYKANVGGAEEKPFFDDYETVFSNTPASPEDATITWDGPGIISFQNMYLVVKDGNSQNPNVYVFDLVAAGWTGTQTIYLVDFWNESASNPQGNGSISHVSIMTGGPEKDPPPGVPEPTSLAIWALGMVAAGIGARRMRKSK